MKLLIAMTIAASLTASMARAQASSAEEMEARIQAVGAKATVAGLSHNMNQWNALLDRVSSGEPAWLTVAEHLRPGTDASSTETLDAAVSIALPHNPDAVLMILGPVFQVQTVCRDPRIEVSGEQHKLFLEQTRDALEGVTRPALVSRRNACLRELPID